MFTKLLVRYVAVAILCIATESFAYTYEIIEIDPEHLRHQIPQNKQCQEYRSYYDNYYKNYYYNYFKLQHANQKPHSPNIDLAGEKVEWVCTNPKTKDIMIIGSEEVLANNNGQLFYPDPSQYKPPPQHQRPNYAPPNYNYPASHRLPPNSYPQKRPQVSFPTDQPNYKPHQPPQQPQKHQEPQTDKPNTNGEGIIDIRFEDD